MSAVFQLPGLWYFVIAARTDSDKLQVAEPNSATRVIRSLIRRIQGYSRTTEMLSISQTALEVPTAEQGSRLEGMRAGLSLLSYDSPPPPWSPIPTQPDPAEPSPSGWFPTCSIHLRISTQ